MTTATRGETTVLSLIGEIDIQSAPELVARLSELEAQEDRDVVIDLSAVDFLDSSALGALISAHRSLAEAGRSLRIACPRPQISKIFRITRVADVIELYETVDD